MSQDQLRSDARKLTDLKICQLQQYLHHSGKIPTSVHPFVKQKIAQEVEQKKHPQSPSFPWREIDRRWNLIGIIASKRWDTVKSWMHFSGKPNKS
ncbi:hypothetical protein [Limnothrix redekei]|uniref:Uncharacterized protein n=1 Tax=Limnothrix redekei LRLZ20PSL1 TaxID=3112953 RepID=A0ABW7CCH0_9CYAN